MRTTNRHNLPETIQRALIKRDEMYNSGKVDTSVTQLIQPPQITILRKKHFREMTRDVSENFWALLGSGVHSILELGATDNMTVEERLFMSIDGWKISGAIDVQEIEGEYVDIIDYKNTSVYSLSGDDVKTEWVQQLNLYAMLVEANKPHLKVRSLKICAILRDWSSAQSKRDALYPEAPIQMVDVPVWSAMKREAYARERIALHREARFAESMEDALPECTPEDRWVKEDKWAVIKEGATKASRVFDNEEEAASYRDAKGSGFSIQHRPGKSTRCEYCGVADWCGQYAAMDKGDVDD